MRRILGEFSLRGGTLARCSVFAPCRRRAFSGACPAPHSSNGTAHAGRMAIRQNLRARLPCLRRPKGRRRVPSESLAFVEGYRPPHSSNGTAHAGRMAIRQNLRARLHGQGSHGQSPWDGGEAVVAGGLIRLVRGVGMAISSSLLRTQESIGADVP